MFGMFQALLSRFKGIFVREAAMDLEADLLHRSAERHAELERHAQRFEEEGLPGVARFLRAQAERMDPDRPLAGVLATAENLRIDIAAEETMLPRLVGLAEDEKPRAIAAEPSRKRRSR